MVNKTQAIEKKFNVIRIMTSIAIALVITFIIIALVSDSPVEVIKNFLLGPFESSRRLGNIVEGMIPLIFTGVGVSIMYSANQINLASEGAFFLGGVATSYVAINFALPYGIHPVIAIIAGGMVGAVVTSIPAIMYLRYKSLPVVSSIMMNYVALYFGLFIINYVIRDPQAGYMASMVFNETSKLPVLISGTKIHFGIIFAVAVLIFGHYFLEKSKYGYNIKLVGKNPNFVKYSGVALAKTILMAQVIGGFLAGMGGAVEQLGMYNRFQYQGLSNHGFDGVMIAIIAQYKPKFVPLAAFFLAYIRVGADVVARTSDVPNEIVFIIQAVIIMFIAAERFLAGWKHRKIVESAQAELELSAEGAA